MIDNFALALSHGLMLLAAWRLIRRPDLNDEGMTRTATGSASFSRANASRPMRKHRTGA